MKVYHGSLNHVRKPNIEKGRSSTDFSRGFYVTTNIEQAKRWALNKQRTAGGETQAIINIYEVADNLLDKKNYNIRKFDAPDGEWLSFVVNCRKSISHAYDIVIGAMANDQVYNYISDFVSGILTREQFWVLAKFKHPTHQVNFCTEEALKCLTFIESEEAKV